ncbi:hypothetical protein CEE36_07825 [candidate division TA06 bacterium B3_TA06]|uniref:TRASH domain-containing protein n=1 Tax=candidate division TA06 bacterium B3_TA06 TaxID=2012487 RepID=A0A532V427_UNCT6|nr:MAG: hypothetical protein CEE36_07825 [candidate division TA06 bacterium B3_TA06]
MLKKTLPTLLGAALLFGAVVLVGFLAGCGSKAKTDEVTKKATDPTCGMEVTVTDETPTYEYEGKTYYFCSADCKTKFVADPGEYMEEHHEEMEEEMHGEGEHHRM